MDTVPSNWKTLVPNSREKSTDKLYNLTKTGFGPEADKTAEEILKPSSIANKGAIATEDQRMVASSNSASGNRPMTPASKGDTDGNDLVMPEMINLEPSGLPCSARVAS